MKIRILNAIYTQGILTGLIVKKIYFGNFKYSIPFWIVGYDKELGLFMRELAQEIYHSHEKNEEN